MVLMVVVLKLFRPQHLLLVYFLVYNTALGNLTRSKLGLKCRQGIGLDEVERFWEWSLCKNFQKTLLGNARHGKAGSVEKVEKWNGKSLTVINITLKLAQKSIFWIIPRFWEVDDDAIAWSEGGGRKIYLEVRDTHLCTDVHSDKYVYAAEVHTLRGSAAVNQDQCKGATPAYTSHTSHTSYTCHTSYTSHTSHTSYTFHTTYTSHTYFTSHTPHTSEEH